VEIALFKAGHVTDYYCWLLCSSRENNIKGKTSQNTTVLLDVNETTCFGLLGNHQVAKFYDTKYCLRVADVEIS
jgi:hypothetical protein